MRLGLGVVMVGVHPSMARDLEVGPEGKDQDLIASKWSWRKNDTLLGGHGSEFLNVWSY